MCVCACQAWFEPTSELLLPLIWGPNPSLPPSPRCHLPHSPLSCCSLHFTGRGDTAGCFTMKTPVFQLIHMYTQTNGCLVTGTMRRVLCYFCNLYFEGIKKNKKTKSNSTHRFPWLRSITSTSLLSGSIHKLL